MRVIVKTSRNCESYCKFNDRLSFKEDNTGSDLFQRSSRWCWTTTDQVLHLHGNHFVQIYASFSLRVIVIDCTITIRAEQMNCSQSSLCHPVLTEKSDFRCSFVGYIIMALLQTVIRLI